MSRIVCWFSCGAASACATKKAIEVNNNQREIVVVRIRIQDEHPDSDRFTQECEKWFGVKIHELADTKYGASVNQVISSTRYMSGPRGARCTLELKKNVRREFQRHDDTHVFGFHVGEEHRIDQVLDAEPTLDIWCPLIELSIDKKDCYDMIHQVGIDLPMMYRLGYNNNNCIGCLKATGAGYWNKIRKDFPEVFNTRCLQEEMLDVAMVQVRVTKLKKRLGESVYNAVLPYTKPHSKDGKSIRVPLRFLPSDMGRHAGEKQIDCGILCEVKDKHE